MRQKNVIILCILILLLLAGSIYSLSNIEEKVNMGLDIRGGVYVLLEASDPEGEVSSDAIQRAMTVIRNRVDAYGMSEPEIRKEGEDRIRIELPGVEDQAQAMELIGTTARLSFVGPDDEELLTGEHLNDAYTTRDSRGLAAVGLEFDGEGTRLFAEATQMYLGEQIAIVLDGNVVSAPRVNSVIPDGSAVIEGDFSFDEASNLALMLRSGALPVDLLELEARTIGPTLGADSCSRSMQAGMIGLGLVLLFMLIYYRFLGLVADFMLIVYISLVVMIMSAFNATLTLPGIAGLILSIGMAVDANVIIFERVKEELKTGKTPRSAVEAGFKRAFRAIIDANVTTLIAAGVLLHFGTGPIQGFAVTLTIGILTSMFTAILLTRFFLRLIFGAKLINNPRLLGARGVRNEA